MAPKTFIFIGRSGCGKGTQADIIKKHLETMDPENRKVLYLETGPRFRDFIKAEGFSSTLSAEVARTTARQPEFLAIWNWSHVLIEEMTGNEHLLVDGTPRALIEAKVFDTAMTFYKRERPVVVYVDVSNTWSRELLLKRHEIEGRDDDQKALIEARLTWFDDEIMPAVQYYEHHPGYQFVHVNGEQSIEQVAKDIADQLSW